MGNFNNYNNTTTTTTPATTTTTTTTSTTTTTTTTTTTNPTTTSTTLSSTSTTTTGSPVVNANGWFYLPGYLKGSVPLYQYTHNYPGYQLRHGPNTISNSLIPFWQTNPFLIRGRPQP